MKTRKSFQWLMAAVCVFAMSNGQVMAESHVVEYEDLSILAISSASEDANTRSQRMGTSAGAEKRLF